MPDINKIMNKYMEPVNEGIVGDVVKGIKSAAHEVAVKVREMVTQAAVNDMSMKQLESKIAEWRDYIVKLKEKATAEKKEGKDIAEHQKNYQAALRSLSIMEVQHDKLKREEKKKDAPAGEKENLAASRAARPSVSIKTKEHKERVKNSKLSKMIRAHKATKEMGKAAGKAKSKVLGGE